MTEVLPQARTIMSRRDAYHMLCLAPLEHVTRSLLAGDEWELDEIRQFANRCRALADAYDARAKVAGIK